MIEELGCWLTKNNMTFEISIIKNLNIDILLNFWNGGLFSTSPPPRGVVRFSVHKNSFITILKIQELNGYIT